MRLVLDGMLLMMSLYSFACFFQQRKNIFLEYGTYIVCMVATFWLDDIDYQVVEYAAGANYWVVLLESIAFTLYIRFSIHLIEIPIYDPLSYKILRILIAIIIFQTILDTILWQMNVSAGLRSQLYITFRLLLVAGAFVVVPRIFRLKLPVIRYFITGSFFFVLGCLLALALNFIPTWFTRTPTNALSYPVAYIELGVVIEVICYTLGISLKNRYNELEKIEAQQQYIEQLKENDRKQQSLRRIRDEIARDLHDELGADLGSISMLSHVAGIQVNAQPQEAKETLQVIGQTARNIANAMRQIVWSLHSMHDNVDNFMFRLKETAYTLFEHLPIKLHLGLPDTETELSIPTAARRDLFLMYKEILNNVIRHANAKNVYIESTIANNTIQIMVLDDGVGFDQVQHPKAGNGLLNLQQRARQIGGSCVIESNPKRGTKVQIHCPLTVG